MYYHTVLNELSINMRTGRFEEMLERFKATEDSLEKLRIIDELEQNGGFRRPECQPRIPKSNAESTKFRTMGNDEFQKQTNAGYLAALELYNKSICYAENGSEELGIGFANRSAVYFELGLYADCIDNIKTARKSVPARLMDKLNRRQGQCSKWKDLKTNHLMPGLIPKLTFPPNVQIPFIANCLKLEQNVQYGRSITTTTNLKPGDVVAIEDAFCSMLDKKFRYVRCEKCLKENNYNLVPCQLCVSVMFCKTCRDEAFETFHKFECPIIDLMPQMSCTHISSISFRTLIRSITSFKSVESLVTFIEETRGQDLTIFDCDYTKESSHYAPVHFTGESRSENNKKDDRYGDISTYILATLFCQPLLELTEFKDMFNDEKAVSTLKELIVHHIKREPRRRAGSTYNNGTKFFEYARGVHPFRDLLNHSCAPNLRISSVGSKYVFTVSKPIKAGEQLSDNCYDAEFRYETRAERQKKINFRCQCKACKNNYPLESKMAKGRPIPDLRLLRPLSMDSLNLCAVYLNKYNGYYPCRQMLFAELEFGVQLELVYQSEQPMEKRYK